MRRTPWWGLLSSAAAPVLLIGGWTLAAARQPNGFDSMTQTVSALAARGASQPQVMTTALAGLGLCHCATALALRNDAAHRGVGLLALGGASTILVAAFPLPASGGSVAHTVAAGTAFGALAVWPFFAARRPVPGGPAGNTAWAVRSRPSVVAGLCLSALVVVFVRELGGGSQVGLAERVAAGAQSLWPLAVVLSARRLTRE